jgi:hypothetical protein
LIRAKFRSHRPPPPYITYTMVRYQKDTNGFTDYVGSYTYHIWCRTSDRAALKRKVFRDTARGDLEFDRPAFNEDRDPGPPTADVFEPAPLKAHPVTFVPTAEPTNLPVIGSVTAIGEFDYKVVSMDVQGSELHLVIEPTRTPERNRLRELFVDKSTLEIHKLIATDTLFVEGPRVTKYRVGFTILMGTVAGHPVITDLHGTVYDGYDDDGKDVDFHYKDITFPDTLPAWYFDPHSYAAHKDEAPL